MSENISRESISRESISRESISRENKEILFKNEKFIELAKEYNETQEKLKKA